MTRAGTKYLLKCCVLLACVSIVESLETAYERNGDVLNKDNVESGGIKKATGKKVVLKRNIIMREILNRMNTTKWSDGFQARLQSSCPLGKYGTLCNSSCLAECRTCSNGDTCSSCPSGMTGSRCENTCSRGCQDDICDIDGQCTCMENFTGNTCKACIPTQYGGMCELRCPTHCLSCLIFNSSTSDASELFCNSCEEGYMGSQCQQLFTCPSNCSTCDSSNVCTTCKTGYFGENCEKSCGERCASYGGRCDRTSGNCFTSLTNSCADTCLMCFEHATCTSCKPGYYDTNCTSNCSIGCLNNECNKTGSCQCKKYFTGDKCDKCKVGKYGTYCNITCPTNCIYCDPNKCLSCVSGFYGPLCNLRCPKNCDNDGCFMISGLCKSCKSGWGGPECDVCIAGGYIDKGDNCVPCSENCLGRQCRALDGKCDIGCMENHYGNQCEMTCSNGCVSLGYLSNCSEKDGACYHGCMDGYYGDQCMFQCDWHCINNTCNINSGVCSMGCEPGYQQIGNKCISEAKSSSSESSSTMSVPVLVAVTVIATIVFLGCLAVCLFLLYRCCLRNRRTTKERSTTWPDGGLKSYDTSTWNYQNMAHQIKSTEHVHRLDRINSGSSMTSEMTSPENDAYQSLQKERQGDSYMSLIVNLAEGEVRVVSNGGNGRDVDAFRKRATTASGIQFREREGAYKNVPVNKRFQSERDVTSLYEEPDKTPRTLQCGRSRPIATVHPKTYVNMPKEDSGYIDMEYNDAREVKPENMENAYYSVVDVHM